MIKENQRIRVKITNKNKKHYIELGYKIGDSNYIEVKPEHLSKGSHARVKLYCDFCGCEFEKTWKDIFKNNQKTHCCRKCVGKKSNLTAKDNGNKERDWHGRALSFCNEHGYTLVTKKEELTHAHSIAQYICPKHGLKETKVMLLAYGHGCSDCQYENIDGKYKNNPNALKKELLSYGLEILNPEEYEGWSDTNLMIKCPNCGKEYISSFNNIRRNYREGAKNLCRDCLKPTSLGEIKIADYLKSHNISFEKEKRFLDCKDKLTLPFDFYLPDDNLIIEFMGKQHYEPVPFFGGEEAFKIRKSHDKYKKRYCLENGIRYLSIPYSNMDKIDSILDEQLT